MLGIELSDGIEAMAFLGRGEFYIPFEATSMSCITVCEGHRFRYLDLVP